jgi:hypothetical protein
MTVDNGVWMINNEVGFAAPSIGDASRVVTRYVHLLRSSSSDDSVAVSRVSSSFGGRLLTGGRREDAGRTQRVEMGPPSTARE